MNHQGEKLSGPQIRMLRVIANGKECPVRGNQYRTARVLSERGLARIVLGPYNRQVAITDRGRAALEAHQ